MVSKVNSRNSQAERQCSGCEKNWHQEIWGRCSVDLQLHGKQSASSHQDSGVLISNLHLTTPP